MATELWAWQDGTPADDGFNAVAMGLDGSSVWAGYENGTKTAVDTPGAYLAAVKVDSEGAVLWKWQDGGTGSYDSRINAVATGEDGSVVLAGFADLDFVVIKLDEDGSFLWRFQAGSGDKSYASGIAMGDDGSVVVAGTVLGNWDTPNLGGTDMAAFKLDTNGTLLWKWQNGTNASDWANAVVVAEDGSAVIAGTSGGDLSGRQSARPDSSSVSSQPVGGDFAAIKLDSEGAEVWRWQDGTSGLDRLNAVSMADDGGFVMAGCTSGDWDGETNAGGHDFAAVKVDTDGNEVWRWQGGTSEDDSLQAAEVQADGTIVLGGHTEGDWAAMEAGGRDFAVVTLDPYGQELGRWQGGSAEMDDEPWDDELTAMAADANGRVSLAGRTHGSWGAPNIGQGDYVAVMLDIAQSVSQSPMAAPTPPQDSFYSYYRGWYNSGRWYYSGYYYTTYYFTDDYWATPAPSQVPVTTPVSSAQAPAQSDAVNTALIVAGVGFAVVGAAMIIALMCCFRKRRFAKRPGTSPEVLPSVVVHDDGASPPQLEGSQASLSSRHQPVLATASSPATAASPRMAAPSPYGDYMSPVVAAGDDDGEGGGQRRGLPLPMDSINGLGVLTSGTMTSGTLTSEFLTSGRLFSQTSLHPEMMAPPLYEELMASAADRGGGVGGGGADALQPAAFAGAARPPTGRSAHSGRREDGGGDERGWGVSPAGGHASDRSDKWALSVKSSTADISMEERGAFSTPLGSSSVECPGLVAAEAKSTLDELSASSSSPGGRGSTGDIGLGQGMGGGVDKDLERSCPDPGVQEAAAVVSFLVDLLNDNGDGEKGTEESHERCQSMVNMLQRAVHVLRQGEELNGREERDSMDHVHDAIFDLVELVKTYRNRNRLPQLMMSALFRRRQDEMGALVDTVSSFLQRSTGGAKGEPSAEDRGARRRRKLDELEIPEDDLSITDELLGKGGFGEVYLADYNGRNAAAKILPINHELGKLGDRSVLDGSSGGQLARKAESGRRKGFLLELDAMIHLRSPYTVNVYGAVTSRPDRLVLVMELLAGGDLRHMLKSAEEQLPEYQCLQIIGDICAGMAFLHRRETVHGDLKSANVLLDGFGRAVIADFGSSRWTRSAMSTGLATFTGTSNQTTQMSLSWSAPEVLDAAGSTYASDVYSFGIVVWEVLARELPWSAVTHPKELYIRVVLKALRPDIPEDAPTALADVARACWVEKPGDRPTFSAVLEGLKARGWDG